MVKVDHDACSTYVPGAFAAALSQVVDDQSPDVVLGTASMVGKDSLHRN